MRELYRICKSKSKVWRAFPKGQHNDTVAEPGYFEYIRDFVTQEVLEDE